MNMLEYKINELNWWLSRRKNLCFLDLPPGIHSDCFNYYTNKIHNCNYKINHYRQIGLNEQSRI
jgi:hypothetical protein